MKTVQDYKLLGLAFIQGDYINAHEGKKQNPLNRTGVKYCNNSIHNDEKFAIEFAWRNNDGVKPDYKGVIELELNSGRKCTAYVSEVTWIRGFGSSIAKWRPVILQSDDAQDKPRYSFVTAISIDGPKFWNKSMPSFSCPCAAVDIEATKSVQSKEDKLMKPVYTAEMHAKNELPPVGSEFYIEGWRSSQCTMTAIGRDNILFICDKIEYVREIKNIAIQPIIKTIEVNGFDVPAPMSEAPEIGDEYFTPQTGYAVFYCANKWICDGYDHRFLSRGLVHATESAAIAHAKAMLGIDPNA